MVEVNVQHAEVVVDCIDDATDLVVVAYIADCGARLATVRDDRLDSTVRGCLVDVGDDDVCAFAREALGARPAHPGSRRRDERHPVLEPSQRLTHYRPASGGS